QEEARPRRGQAEGGLRKPGDRGRPLRGRDERHPDGGGAARVSQGPSSAAASTLRDFSSCTKATKRGAFEDASRVGCTSNSNEGPEARPIRCSDRTTAS